MEPSTRAKYDTDRSRRYGKFSAYTSPTSNAPNSYQNWSRPAQPPRPTNVQPNNMKSPNMKSPTAGGASQYARWATNNRQWAEPSSAGTQGRSEAANAFKAWGNMKAPGMPGRANTFADKTGQGPGRGTQPPPPPPPNMSGRARPPRPNTFASAASANANPQTTPKARAGWDQFESNAPPPGLSRAKTMRTPKKSGFDPGTDGGDEPPARNASAYYNLHRGSIPHSQRPPPFQARPAPQPSAQKPEPQPPDPFKGFRSPRSEENINDRLSTPYATSGGEKTMFSREGMSRNPSSESASNLKSGWEHVNSAPASPRSPYERHRSASPRMRSPNPQLSSSSSSDESSGDDVAERVKLRPRGYAARTRTNHPKSSQNMPPPPKPFVTVEDPNGETFEFGKPSKRSTWSSESVNSGPRQSENLSPRQAAFRRTSTGDLPESVKNSNESYKGSRPSSPLRTSTPLTNNGNNFEPLEKPAGWQDASSHKHFDPPESCGPQPKYDSMFSLPQFSLLRNLNFKIPFTSSASPDAASPCPNSDKVLPSKGVFPGNLPSPNPLNWNKGCLYAMMNRADQNRSSSSFPNGSSGSTSPTKDGRSEKSASQFSQQDWQQKFSDPSANPFHPPPSISVESRGRASPVKSRGNTANRTPRKMSAASKRPTFPMPASVSATSSEAEEKVAGAASMSKQSSAGRSSNGSAMDIDSNPPPSASEMRSTHDPLGDTIRSRAPNKTPTASAAASPTRPDTESAAFNLNNIAQAAPFTPSNTDGLGDLDDLGSNLPFRSQPASTLPTADIHEHNLALPNPPRPPKPPNVSALTRKAYDYYMVFVRSYMAEWNMFNQKMVAHFTARQTMIENHLPKYWLDGIGQEGYLQYMAWMKEDRRVRTHWDVSYEKHVEAMETLGKVREVALAGKMIG